MSETYVLKFGGTSLQNGRRVQRAARRVRAHLRAGRRVVVVVSATGRSTDRIIERLRTVAPRAREQAGREYDRALATGEDLSAALLAAALCELGIAARSLRAPEAGLFAQGPHAEAHLHAFDSTQIGQLLECDVVPVITGFQAVRADGELVTIGRGGSDATAVFLAGQLNAASCHIITDVAAVCDSDPRLNPHARPLPQLSHDALVRITEAGGEVVQCAAAHFAAEFGTLLYVYHFNAPLRARAGTAVGALASRRRAS